MNNVLKTVKDASHKMMVNRCDEALKIFSTAYADPYFYGKRHRIMKGIDELLDLRFLLKYMEPTTVMVKLRTIVEKYSKDVTRKVKKENYGVEELSSDTAF